MATKTPSNPVAVGRIAGIFGIHGELKCDPTSSGRMLFARGAEFEARLADGTRTILQLDRVREHKGRLLITLCGVASANDAERYAGTQLYADPDRIELDPGEYWIAT